MSQEHRTKILPLIQKEYEVKSLSMEAQLKLSLSSFLTDKEIVKLIEDIKNGKIEKSNVSESC